MSAAVGVLVVVAFAGVLNPLVLFGVGMLVGFVAMVTQRSTRATVGVGLYVSALAALLVPLGWYGRSVFAGGGGVLRDRGHGGDRRRAADRRRDRGGTRGGRVRVPAVGTGLIFDTDS
jgi:hypothetical protein